MSAGRADERPPGPLARALLRGRYACRRLLSTVSPEERDEYHRIPDVYNVVRNGDARFVALGQALAEIGPVESLLELGCYEGYAAAHLLQRGLVKRYTGVDVSARLLARASARCRDWDARFFPFDLERLYRDPDLRGEPWMQRHDVVLVAELLYYLGPRAYWLWRDPDRAREAKRRFVAALQKLAARAVVLQHFGAREKEAIGAIARLCGGRLLDERWGLWICPPA